MKRKKIYHTVKSSGLFESEMTSRALSDLDNPLERLTELIDFEIFRPELEAAVVNFEGKTAAGRPRMDVVMMFKALSSSVITT